MKTALLFPIVVIFAACFVMLLLATKKGKGRTGAYKSRKLMTDNEEEFFGRLVAALPDHYIFPQVAMSAILQPASSKGKQAHSDRLRIAQQRVDYVVCTKRCDIVAVIELDDRTHSQAKDQLRDARLEQGGIRTVRFQARNKPKVDVIRAMVLGMASAEKAEVAPLFSVAPASAGKLGIKGTAGKATSDGGRAEPSLAPNQG